MDIILEYVLNIIYALLIFVIGKWLVKEITGVAVKFLRKIQNLMPL